MPARRTLTTLAVLAALAVVVVAVGGCSGPRAAAVPGGPATSGGDGVVSSGPMPPVSAAPSETATEVVPEPAEDLVAVRWHRAEPVGGRAELLVRGTLTGGPPCAVVSRVDVAEASTVVTVTVWVGRRPGADCSGPQVEVGFPYVTRVALAAPLGTREVRDGAR